MREETTIKIKLITPEEYNENYYKAFLLALSKLKCFTSLPMIGIAAIVFNSIKKYECNSYETFESIMKTIVGPFPEGRKYVIVIYNYEEDSLIVNENKYKIDEIKEK